MISRNGPPNFDEQANELGENRGRARVPPRPCPRAGQHIEHVDVPIGTPRVGCRRSRDLAPLVALDHSVAQCDDPRHAVRQGWVVRHDDDGRSALRVDREK